MSEFYAHTKKDSDGNLLPEDRWEPLFTEDTEECGTITGEPCSKCERLDSQHGHLNKVAYLCSKFATEMFPEGSEDSKLAAEWGRLAGLWHDLGKFSLKFQSKLYGENVSVEHSGAGAAFAKMIFSNLDNQETDYYPLAATIAGHHSGLSNYKDQGAGKSIPLIQRLRNNESVALDWTSSNRQRLFDIKIPNFHEWNKDSADLRKVNLSLPFFVRQLFSCLVDADSLVTEALEEEAKNLRDFEYDSFETLRERFDRNLLDLSSKEHDPAFKEINGYRNEILTSCQKSAKCSNGVFSLNVPTGGGKTLSGMSFALRHAIKNGQKRIIVIAPYTTIIEQTADEYRKFLEEENVIEHHSNLDDFNDSDELSEAEIKKQLAAENWDAPIIVTTTVQFFESLFANKRSRCRKLHNIANATIIIDEAQCLPNSVLDPTLFVMNELVEHYNCSIIFSTATQPAFHYRLKFPCGFREITPILPKSLTEDLHQKMTRRRINIDWRIKEPLDSNQASQLVAEVPEKQKLIVVNTRKEASVILGNLKDKKECIDSLFHLSTNLCPAHRREKLAEIKALLKSKAPCTVVSTQLIECGVDHSYQCVVRSMAGLDSLAQSAGRCNRHGENESGGKFIVYQSDKKLTGFLGNCETVARMVLGNQPPEHLADLTLYENYFKGLYQAGESRDTCNVFQAYREYNLEDVGMRYRMIDDYKQFTVVVPWGEAGRERLQKVRDILRSENSLGRKFLRALQPFTVSLSRDDFEIIKPYTEPLLEGGFSYFVHPDCLGQIYDPDLGLKLYSKNDEYLGCH